MTYKCQFPNCTYETNNRHQIHYHHIKPKELGGIDKDSNRLWVCPNHHTSIFIPESSNGIHSINTKVSIILHNIYKSTGGRVLEYESNGITDFHLIRE